MADSAVYNIDNLKLTLFKSKKKKSALKSLVFKTKSFIDGIAKDFSSIELKSMGHKFILNFK